MELVVIADDVIIINCSVITMSRIDDKNRLVKNLVT